MAFVAARLPGAPAHCLVRKSQKRAYVVKSASHAEPPTIVHLPSCWVELYVSDDLMAALPLASPPGLVRLIPFDPGSARLKSPAKPYRPEHGKVLKAYLTLLWFATLAQVMRLYPSVPWGAMKWSPHILNSRTPGWGGGTSWRKAGPGHIHGPHGRRAGPGPVLWAGRTPGTP